MSPSGLPAKSLPRVHSAQKVARSASSWRCEGQALPRSLSFNDLEYSSSPCGVFEVPLRCSPLKVELQPLQSAADFTTKTRQAPTQVRLCAPHLSRQVSHEAALAAN